MQDADATEAEDKIKRYWDNRAVENDGSPQGTTDDVYLRTLELQNIVETIKELALPDGGMVIDIGCGDGLNTLNVAALYPHLRFVGVDFSENMIRIAERSLASYGLIVDQVRFVVGDAMVLDSSLPAAAFDLAITDRCLINLPSLAAQSVALAQIADRLKPGGYYLAIENFKQGQDNMNRLRRAVGLPEIPIRWHNLYFDEQSFVSATTPFFELTSFKDFSSSYYFATRVVYSALCRLRGEQPDYQHDIHKIAVKLPWFGEFSPIRMAVLRRK